MDLDKNLLQIIGGAWTAQKLLGPSLEYLGGELKHWTEIRLKNLRRIFENAGTKLRNPEDGSVPPRVLRQVVNDGSFCDDQLFVEYFGGILAGSRTDNPSDDRALTLASLVSRLSTFQIRAHYLFYTAAREVYTGTGVKLNERCDLQRACVFIPLDAFCKSVGIAKDKSLSHMCPHILGGLERENVIGPSSGWGFRKTEILERLSRGSVVEPGVIVRVNSVGIELYLWAHGWRDKNERFFLDPSTALETHPDVDVETNARAILLDEQLQNRQITKPSTERRRGAYTYGKTDRRSW